MELHVYIATLGGRCGACGQPEESGHPPLLDVVDPLTECRVDHNGLISKLVVADGGARWYYCSNCTVQVEPRMADRENPEPVGVPYGPGRGILTERMKVAYSGWAGWADRIGH